MIILDTQPLSQLQLGSPQTAATFQARRRAKPEEGVKITIISPYEQFRECLGNIHSNNKPEKQRPDFLRLIRLLDFYAGWQGLILPFDEAATAIFNGFPAKLRRSIGPMDSRIAAIVLANRGTLITANLRHFQQVPGLSVEDWLRD